MKAREEKRKERWREEREGVENGYRCISIQTILVQS
jgi:hypothetical protein